tara:strand:- start:88 stop:915 length:828 start_codon:yes stop_codon:yes gene_type:complete
MANKLRNFIYKNKYIFFFYSFIFLRKYSPIKLITSLIFKDQYSDFFIYATKFEENVFIAENMFALLGKKPRYVIHKFRFYNKKGVEIKNYTFKSNDFFSKIILPRIYSPEEYLSFTHECLTNKEDKLFVISENKKSYLSQEHRGYTIYKKTKISLGNSVHGNFGRIYPNDKKIANATQRNYFIYTPIYCFEKDCNYHIVFNNPTNKNLKVQIIKNINGELSKKLGDLDIKEFGTNFINLENYYGTISILSKMPICRPLIFKNPGILDNNFDVFHS